MKINALVIDCRYERFIYYEVRRDLAFSFSSSTPQSATATSGSGFFPSIFQYKVDYSFDIFLNDKNLTTGNIKDNLLTIPVLCGPRPVGTVITGPLTQSIWQEYDVLAEELGIITNKSVSDFLIQHQEGLADIPQINSNFKDINVDGLVDPQDPFASLQYIYPSVYYLTDVNNNLLFSTWLITSQFFAEAYYPAGCGFNGLPVNDPLNPTSPEIQVVEELSINLIGKVNSTRDLITIVDPVTNNNVILTDKQNLSKLTSLDSQPEFNTIQRPIHKDVGIY